ncbi:nitrilase-related carbon-nitrogen hydrolase [Leifsonia poae]|uniref:nitrilase-related carbon-nitrogen hydrolase n=1 Tax=Leifsonia poae TaxID=110933 RepID=UPI001CBDC4B3|nr:nitrilase-related carbon-nitrogen hydrolase [Leifsonia poae]
MTSPTVSVACCQIAPRIGDVPGNRRRAREAIVAAADAGARVVVLPELANTGYLFRDEVELHALSEPANGPTIAEWCRLARERRLVIVAGFAERDPDEPGPDAGGVPVYNSAAVIDETGVLAIYRKAHLWDHEKVVGFTPGEGAPPVVDTAVGRIGVMVCYDLEFPEWVREVALAGAELVCAPVNWPRFPRPVGERPGEIVRVQADASVNRIFLAVADRTGAERGQEWLGGSAIVDPDGYPLALAALGEPGMIVAQLDLAEARRKSISDNNDVHADRRPDLYGSLSGKGTR